MMGGKRETGREGVEVQSQETMCVFHVYSWECSFYTGPCAAITCQWSRPGA